MTTAYQEFARRSTTANDARQQRERGGQITLF